jgi:diaminopimelate epimerase
VSGAVCWSDTTPRREPPPDWTSILDLAFSKMHGLGNDFIVIEDLSEELEFSTDAVQWFCDRHFGIGADGLILVRPSYSADADFYMHYLNADGSLAEMCGNGVRCFAKYLVDHDLVSADRDTLAVETLGGIKPIGFIRDAEGKMSLATVDMGAPRLAAEEVPTTLKGDPVLGRPLETSLGTFEVTCVSMGNPHCIIWVDDAGSAPVEEVGPLIETHAAFPNKTNVEFAEFAGDESIRLRVWERGCGETLACGTGACATVVAASLAGLVGREATVELPGGELEIRWDEAGDVFMTGPAAEVFRGVVVVPEDSQS